MKESLSLNLDVYVPKSGNVVKSVFGWGGGGEGKVEREGRQ